MSVPVTLEWCGACGSESTAAVCTTCGLSVRGTDADELRSCVLSYRAATAHGDVATADVVRARHARALARLAAAARDPRPTEPGPSETGDARASASTLVTWVGAALLLAGALAFASVVWQYAGGAGRIAILAAVTLAAFAAADRLRAITPTTAEASTVIAAGMTVVDVVAIRVAGYAPDWDVLLWTAATMLPAGIAFVVLSRAWGSRAASASGVVLVAIGAAALAASPLRWDTSSAAALLSTFAAGAGSAALGLAAARAARGTPERAALIVAAAMVWTVQLGVTTLLAVTALVDREGSATTTTLARSLSVAVFLALPLLVPVRSAGRGVLAGLAAAAALVSTVWLTIGTVFSLGLSADAEQALTLLSVATLVVVPSLVGRWATSAGALGGEAARAIGLAVPALIAYALGAVLLFVYAGYVDGTARSAVTAAVVGLVGAVPAVLLEGRAPRPVTALGAAAAVAGPLLALALVLPEHLGRTGGEVLAVLGAVVVSLSLVVGSRTWRLGVQGAGAAALVLAPLLTLTSVEWWSIPAAVVAAALGVQLWRDGVRSSWVVEAPAAALLLGPTLLAGVLGDRTGLRLTCVAVVGAVVLLDSARRHRQGPAVVSVTAIGVALTWVVVPRLSETPSWAWLAGAGLLLLWTGFTWERRRATARHLVQSWSTWE